MTSLNPVPNAQVCVYLTIHITNLQLQITFPKPLYIPHSHVYHISHICIGCRNPTLAKCEDETHIRKVGDLESSRTLECLEFDSKAQNTSHWGVLGVIGKVLKCRCAK